MREDVREHGVKRCTQQKMQMQDTEWSTSHWSHICMREDVREHGVNMCSSKTKSSALLTLATCMRCFRLVGVRGGEGGFHARAVDDDGKRALEADS
jgi:hypothetical protein